MKDRIVVKAERRARGVNRRRRLGALALVGAASAVAAGCGSSSSSTPGNAAGKKLVLFTADPANTKYYNHVDQAFEKKYHVKISLTAYPSASFMQPYDAAVTGHTPLDLLLANGQNVAFMHQHHQLVDLKGAAPLSTLRPGTTTPFVFSGDPYALPVGSGSTSAVIYNKSLLSRFHLKPPSTVAQVIADGKILAPHHLSVFATPGATIYLWPIWYMQTLAQSTGGKPEQTTLATVKHGSPSFTSPVYEKAMAVFSQLGKAPGVFESGVNGVNETAAVAQFDQGKSLMFYGGSWDVLPAAQGAKFPVGLEGFPTYVPGATLQAAGGPGIAAAIYQGIPSGDLAIAKKWIAYMTSPAVDRYLVTAEKATLPEDVGVKAPAAASGGSSGSQYQAINATLLKTFVPKTFTFLDWTWPATVTTAIQHDIQAVVGGQMSPSAAMQNVQSTFAQSKSSGS